MTPTIVFQDPTLAGLALAAGATLVEAVDRNQQVQFTLINLPPDFASRHARGEVMVSTLDAAREITKAVQIVRATIRLRKMTAERRPA